jgi:hypothetical protein
MAPAAPRLGFDSGQMPSPAPYGTNTCTVLNVGPSGFRRENSGPGPDSIRADRALCANAPRHPITSAPHPLAVGLSVPSVNRDSFLRRGPAHFTQRGCAAGRYSSRQ